MHDGQFSRRSFLGGAAALGAASLIPGRAFGADAKPDSKFGGVQVGVITYSYRSMPGDAESLLQHVLKEDRKYALWPPVGQHQK